MPSLTALYFKGSRASGIVLDSGMFGSNRMAQTNDHMEGELVVFYSWLLTELGIG